MNLHSECKTNNNLEYINILSDLRSMCESSTYMFSSTSASTSSFKNIKQKEHTHIITHHHTLKTKTRSSFSRQSAAICGPPCWSALGSVPRGRPPKRPDRCRIRCWRKQEVWISNTWIHMVSYRHVALGFTQLNSNGLQPMAAMASNLLVW